MSRLAAALLTGSWRHTPPVFQDSLSDADMSALAELLPASGTGALAWRTLCASGLANSPGAQPFRDAFRMHALEAAVHERSLGVLLRLLREAGVRPILLKGWSVARLYPAPGLRPYGDIDLLVTADEVDRVRTVLKAPELDRVEVDWSDACEDMNDIALEDLRGAAVEARVGEESVRLLSPEHTLRHLCIHQLRHGLWRPLWLCDVALVVENLPPSFDWDRCLAGSRWAAEGVLNVIALARDLLGADTSRAPLANHQVPAWLAPAVLEQWPRKTEHYYSGVPLGAELAHPLRFLSALRQRWRGPIQATVARRAPWSGRPRLLVQLEDWSARTLGFLRRRGAPLPDD